MLSQISPRKNFGNAVTWWIEEFIDQEVGLVLKTNIKCNSIMDFEAFEKIVKEINHYHILLIMLILKINVMFMNMVIFI